MQIMIVAVLVLESERVDFMQFIFNFIYTFLDFVFGLFPVFSPPLWFLSFISSCISFGLVLNYFVPLSTFISVAIWAFSIRCTLMFISACLEIF